MPVLPASYPTLRLETRGMGCTWGVILNPGRPEEVMSASSALDVVHRLEARLSTFRPESDLSRINRLAGRAPQPVDDDLWEAIQLALSIAEETAGAFDPTSRPLSLLWKRCRDEHRIPTDDELSQSLQQTGFQRVVLDAAARTIHFPDCGPSGGSSMQEADSTPPKQALQALRSGEEASATPHSVQLDLGGIGKGFAIDRMTRCLREKGVQDFLIHGGFSSVYAAGVHYDQPGWPVGLKHPLLEQGDYVTVFLKERGLSTSGTNVQFFRHAGKRYGHILDPRTGRPAEGLLSVTVIDTSAARADALSTALYVLGLDAGSAWCRQHPEVGAILVPAPTSSRVLRPVVFGLTPEELVFQSPEVSPDWHPGRE